MNRWEPLGYKVTLEAEAVGVASPIPIQRWGLTIIRP